MDRIYYAERAGFEPAIPLRVYKLSRLAHSTTLTPLRFLMERKCNKTFGGGRHYGFFISEKYFNTNLIILNKSYWKPKDLTYKVKIPCFTALLAEI